MTKIYVVTAISSCNSELDGDPIAMDDQFVLTDKEAAQEKLAELYNERMAYDGKYGEVIEDESELGDGYFYVVLYDDGNSTTTYYSGKIREYEI